MNNTKFYKKYLMSPGLVRFNTDKEEIILLEKEMIDNNLNTLKQKPVVIGHDSDLSVGEVVDCYFDIDKGYYIVGFNVWDDEAKNLLDNKQFSVSSTYEVVNKTDAVEKYHNMDYDYRVNSLDFINLAIVEKPRYNETKIYVNSLDGEEDIKENGGPGSGNFGHAGRPGKRGGSSSYGSRSYEELSSIVAKKKEKNLKSGGKLFEAIRQKAQERISKDLDLKKRVDEYLTKRKETENIKQKDIQDKESIDIEKGDKAPIQETKQETPIQRKYDYSIEELEKEANERKLKRYQDYLEFRKQYERDNTHTQAEFDLYRSGEKKLKRIEEELKTNPNLSDIEKAKLFSMFDTEYKKMKQDPQKIEERKQKREDKYKEQQEKIKSGDYSIANFGLKRLPGSKQFEEQLGTGAVYKPNKSFWDEYKNNLEKMKEHFRVSKTFDGNWVVIEKTSDKQPIQETKQETPKKEVETKPSIFDDEYRKLKQEYKDSKNKNIAYNKEVEEMYDLENKAHQTKEYEIYQQQRENGNVYPIGYLEELKRDAQNFIEQEKKKDKPDLGEIKSLEEAIKVHDEGIKRRREYDEARAKYEATPEYKKWLEQANKVTNIKKENRGYGWERQKEELEQKLEMIDIGRQKEDANIKDISKTDAENMLNTSNIRKVRKKIGSIPLSTWQNVFDKHIRKEFSNTEPIKTLGDLKRKEIQSPMYYLYSKAIISKYGEEKGGQILLNMFNKSVANNK